MDVRAGSFRGLASLFAEGFVCLKEGARLRVSILGWLALGFLVSVGSSLALALPQGISPPLILLGSVAWWGFCSLFLVGGIPLLVTPEGEWIDVLGLPNGLTAVRAWACLPLLLCATLSLPYHLGLILWCTVGGAVGMLDFVDGAIARRWGPITALGKALDPAMDTLFFSMGAVGSMLLGIIPTWLMALILVRFLGPALLTPVVFLLGKRPELVHTEWGRRNTAATGLVIFVLMWVRIFDGPVGLAAVIVGLPLLVPTTLLHFRALAQRVAAAPLRSSFQV